MQVRAWAAAHDINSAQFGTLNSYTISMMALYHMQTLEESQTPALVELFKHEGTLPVEIDAQTCSAESVKQACSEVAECERDEESKASLAQLFLGFLQHYDALLSAWDCGLPLRVCPRTATLRHDPFDREFPVLVEDPFDTSSNTAAAVADKGAVCVRRAFLDGAALASGAMQSRLMGRKTIDAFVEQLFETSRRAPSFERWRRRRP